MQTNTAKQQLMEIAARIKEMREIMGWSLAEMAEKTEVSEQQYIDYENAIIDFPFTFIHKCALAFDVEMTQLLEGHSAKLSSYTVTRAGGGQKTAKEDGIDITNLAPKFKDKIAEPYYVRYEYSASQQNKPIHLTKHSGQEFDFILSGSLKVQIGEHTEVLHEGDSIYYNSSTPHGMIAVDGKDCVFCAVVLPGEDTKEEVVRKSIVSTKKSENLFNQIFECFQDSNWESTSSYLLYETLLHSMGDFLSCNQLNTKKKRLEPIIEYLDENYSKDISLGDIADFAGVSKTHLCRLFQDAYKIRPFEYLTQIRIKKAKEMMQMYPKMLTSEISDFVGFKSPSYFTLLFKKSENITPSEFRNMF